MNNELLFTIFRLGYLVLLWIMVLAALSVLRKDVFGTVVTRRGKGRHASKAARTPSVTAKPSKGLPGTPGTFPVPEGDGPLYLTVLSGPLTGMTLPLGSAPVLIGRSPSCTLVLDDDYASGRHARLYPDEHAWWLEDLNSTNGTFIDDERVVAPRALRPGERFRVGQSVMEISR